MNRILITGAGGFVGTHLIQALAKEGNHEIFATIYKSTTSIDKLVPSDHLFAGDLTDFEFASSVVKSSLPDVVYHLAALSVVHSSHEQALSLIQSNTALQYNLLEAVKLHAPNARFMAICSANEYGAVQDLSRPVPETAPLRPLNPYAVSKVAQEMLALEYHLAHSLDVVILRPFNHTGVGQTTDFIVPKLAKQFVMIEKGASPVIELGNLETTRDFCDVADMVSAYILASVKCESGQIYNIGSGKGHTIQEILDLFQEISGQKVEVKVHDDHVRKVDVPYLVADASKFKKATGWEPKIPLRQTISDILEYWRNKT